MAGARPYLLRFGAFVALLLAGLVGFNALVDPFDVFGAPPVEGFNRVKHGIRTHTRTAKAYVVRRLQPRTVILGSSRAESAFPPDHPGFAAQPVYNLAFSGAGIYEMRRYFEHAVAVAPLREAVVGVDFGMFDALRARPSWDFDEGRLAVAADGSANPPPWRDLFSLLLSADAVAESAWSLRHQRDRRTTYGPDGLRDERYDIPEILLEYGGHRRTFRHNEQGFACGFADQRRDFAFVAGGNDTLGELARIMDLAQARGIRLTVLIPPVHARHLEVIRQSGLWPAFEDWKRRMADLAAARGAALWDFAQANPVTTEEVPADGDVRTAMHWFRESSHALSAAGREALRRIHGLQPQVAGYGHRLDPGNVDGALAGDREALEAWRGTHPADAAEIADLFRRCAPGAARYTSR